MAEKLSWTDLRRILAKRAGVSEKEANAFLSALTDELVVALKEDKQVKINGLGMFKLQAVAPRKSVNVVTGEEFTIEGYNKMVFVPEAGVKELIEGLEGGNESVDPIKKLDTQAEEIVDILGELGQSPKEEAAAEPAPEAPAPEPEPVFVAPAPEPEPVYVAPAPEPEPVYVAPAPAPEPAPEPFVFTSTPKKEEKKKKEHHFLRDVLICVIILLLLLCCAYFFLREQLGGLIDSFLTNKPDSEIVVPADTTSQVIAEPVDEAYQPANKEAEELTEEQILAEFLEASGDLEDAETPEDQIYEDLITIEPMHEASRLAWMAKRFYGAKIYWPYLYDANKDHITNPCLIEVGTPIRVPRLTPAQKDTTNAQTMATLERLRLEGEAACGH